MEDAPKPDHVSLTESANLSRGHGHAAPAIRHVMKNGVLYDGETLDRVAPVVAGAAGAVVARRSAARRRHDATATSRWPCLPTRTPRIRRSLPRESALRWIRRLPNPGELFVCGARTPCSRRRSAESSRVSSMRSDNPAPFSVGRGRKKQREQQRGRRCVDLHRTIPAAAAIAHEHDAEHDDEH